MAAALAYVDYQLAPEFVEPVARFLVATPALRPSRPVDLAVSPSSVPLAWDLATALRAEEPVGRVTRSDSPSRKDMAFERCEIAIEDAGASAACGRATNVPTRSQSARMHSADWNLGLKKVDEAWTIESASFD